MEFRILGTVEARCDGRPVDLGHPRQQQVLVALLVNANRLVPTEHLMDRVWSGRLPSRGRETLYSYVSRLRRALAAGHAASVRRERGGYVLAVEEDRVDLHRFRHLVAQARSHDDAMALDLLTQALALWRGEPFAGLDAPWIGALRAELTTERIAAELDHTDLMLRCARHSELLASLSARSAERPLDERLAGQLMVTLYRCGRQADALEHYQRVRARLADELGADPSPALQQVHQQILTAAPALDRQAEQTAPMPPPVPRQLPPPPQPFTGRTRELRALTAALDDPAELGATLVISTIGGTGGIGKTWLALHWAHQQRSRHPDGQLYVDLRGFDPGAQPLSSAAAIRGFLEALGVLPAAIPTDPGAQAALYRSLLADKRMLVMLDNAVDAGQITPLLPGSPTCTVLITSRNKLTSLVTTHGARPVCVDVFSYDEARELLARRLGSERLAAEPDAAEDLLDCCAGLPLALGIVAARVATAPGHPLAVLAGELREQSTRLDALDTGDANLSVRAAFSWSHHALSPDAADLLGLLGSAPGPDIGLAATAALTGSPPPPTAALLRKLEAAHLIQQHRPGRYRLHDLIRLCAAEQAHRDLSHDSRTAALRRLVDFYVHTAHAGDRLLQPHRDPIELDAPVAGCHPEPLEDQAAALSWFDAEHPGLLAAHRLADDHRWHTSVWQLAWALRTFHRRRGRHQDDLVIWRAGLAATEHLGDLSAQIQARRFLGHTCSELGHHTEALHHLEHALALAETVEDTAAQAHIHMALGWARKACDASQPALKHLTRAAHLFRTLGNPVWEADALSTIGWFHAESGRLRQAREYCEAVLPTYRRHDDREGEADALNSLAYIAHHTGQFAEALEHYQRARALFRDLGHTFNEADILDCIGHTNAALGLPDAAERAWRQALDLYEVQQRRTEAERITRQLSPEAGQHA